MTRGKWAKDPKIDELIVSEVHQLAKDWIEKYSRRRTPGTARKSRGKIDPQNEFLKTKVALYQELFMALFRQVQKRDPVLVSTFLQDWKLHSGLANSLIQLGSENVAMANLVWALRRLDLTDMRHKRPSKDRPANYDLLLLYERLHLELKDGLSKNLRHRVARISKIRQILSASHFWEVLPPDSILDREIEKWSDLTHSELALQVIALRYKITPQFLQKILSRARNTNQASLSFLSDLLSLEPPL